MVENSSDEFSFAKLYGVESNDDTEQTQEGEAWLEWRSKGIGSSDIGIIMYESPYRDINELWEDKTGLLEKRHTTNWAIERGKRLEPWARDIYEWQTKTEMRPRTFVHRRFKFMRASLDGFNQRLSLGIEIKVPGKKDLELAKQHSLPMHYYAQIQWQMMVADIPAMDYVVLDPDGSEIYVTRILRDPKYQERMTVLARWFWFLVRNKIRPPLRGVDIYEKSLEAVRNGLPAVQSTKKVSKRKSTK
jgi:putative phage-type endonuclease